VLRVVRRKPSYRFISDYVTTRTAELSIESTQTNKQQLASAFDHPATRGSARKLIESILHRVLVHRSVDPFGVGGTSLSELTIISEAANFVFEANAQLPSLPIYLRPRSYAAVDAVLVTDTVIWLIHTSVSDRYSSAFRTLLLILLQLEKRGDKCAMQDCILPRWH
jgi:hypothetical protein